MKIKDYEREINSFNYRLKKKYPFVYSDGILENHYNTAVLFINNEQYWIQWDNGINISYWKMGNGLTDNITRTQFFRVIRDYNEKLKLYHELNDKLNINKGEDKCIKI